MASLIEGVTLAGQNCEMTQVLLTNKVTAWAVQLMPASPRAVPGKVGLPLPLLAQGAVFPPRQNYWYVMPFSKMLTLSLFQDISKRISDIYVEINYCILKYLVQVHI